MTLTLDRNFIGIGKTYIRTNVRTDGHLSPIQILLGRLFGVDLKMAVHFQAWAVVVLQPMCCRSHVKYVFKLQVWTDGFTAVIRKLVD